MKKRIIPALFQERGYYMIKKKFSYLLLLFLLSGHFACKDTEDVQPPEDTDDQDEEVVLKYKNPVFEPVLADPSVLRSGDYFYAYGTEDDWGSEGGHKLVPIIRSENLVDWEFVNNAFQFKPQWKENGGIWAPDVTEVDGRFFMYYSYSTWGDPNPGIGLAIADTPEGLFTDQGKLFLSDEIGVPNSIDPFYIEEEGQKYLFWGSFHGIYAIQLSEDGREVTGEKIRIAHEHLEAAYVYKRNGFYYFFGSQGSCCAGANSTYHVRVGRSTSLLGPYFDKAGRDLATGPHGEVLIRGNEVDYGFAGPGHNAEIISDDEGTDWFLYHAIPKNNPLLENGASRRPLMLDRLEWENDWPVIKNQEPSLTSQTGPVFE
jgi:arabinan endo-1,5-alpha-L-arabinosidase